MNPRRDNNKEDSDDDRWDLSEWDLYEDNGPDDFVEVDPDEPEPYEIDADELHLEVIDGMDDADEERFQVRSIFTRQIVRLTSALLVVIFLAVFVFPEAISAVRVVILKPSAPDYYDLIAPDGFTLKFDRSVIRYSIVIPPNFPTDSLGVLVDPLQRAMDSWSVPLGDRIDFVPATDSGTDDLLVIFVTDLPSAGLATLRAGTRYRPVIYIKTTLTEPMPSPVMLETVACHELGHALGIWGHSTYEGDCMFPMVVRNTPSDRDIRTMRMVYGLEGEAE